MSARYFLDTNIFVYTFDASAPAKRNRAQSLVQSALRSGAGVTSFQVVQEFLNVATRKFATPMKPEDCLIYVDQVLAPLCSVQSSTELYRRALDVHERWQFSFYDSLVVAAALSASCRTLFSEDLQHGQKIRELTVENPFE